MASVLSETPAISPSALSVPVQTIISGQGAQSYVPFGSHSKLFSGAAFLRFGTLSLNPNAEEFIPSALKVGKATQEMSHKPTISSFKSDLSDDEYRQYLHSQLPEDILPDFNASAEDSIFCETPDSADFVDARRNTSSADEPCSFKNELAFVESSDQGLWQQPLKHDIFITETASHKPYKFTSNSSEGLKPKQFPLIIHPSLPRRAMKPSAKNDLQVDYSKDVVRKSVHADTGPATLGDVGPAQSLNFLASKFPNFAVGRLADILFSYGGDLDLTVKMLSQVEPRDRTPPRQSQLSAAAAPYMSVTSISPPSSLLTVNQRLQCLEDAEYQPMSTNNHTGFLSSHWQQEGKRTMDTFSSPIRPSLSSGEGSILDSRVSSLERVGHNIIKDLPRIGRQHWLETEDVSVGPYSERREREPDHVRISNAYYEQQARLAHMAGKNALAKEFNEKGSWLGPIKAGDLVFQQNSCFVNNGHTGQHSPLRPRNIYIH